MSSMARGTSLIVGGSLSMINELIVIPNGGPGRLLLVPSAAAM